MYRIRTVFTGVAGAPWYSNLYFDPAGGNAPASTVLAVDDFWTTLAVGMANEVSWTVEGVVAQVDPATGDIEEYVAIDSQTGIGTNTAPLLPVATQGLIRLNTAAVIRNRRLQGRIFIPGLVNTVTGADGRFTPDWVDTMTDAGNALRTATSGGNLESLGVWSRPKGPSVLYPLPTPGQIHVVTGASASATPSVLRSRRD